MRRIKKARLAPRLSRDKNRSDADCSFVVVSAGNGQPDFGEYPDIDLKFDAGGYSRKDGTPYDGARRP